MTQETDHFLLMGLPDSGKTTFLVALWHVVESQEVPTSLVLKQFFEGNREYIEGARDRWLRYEKVARNKTDASGPIRFSLSERGGAGDLRLTIPDLAGETFRQQFEDRAWSPAFEERVSGVAGLLLFVNAERHDEPTSIVELDDVLEHGGSLAGEVGAADDPEASGEEEDEEDEVPFAIAQCCAAVKLVDLLQFIASRAPKAPLPLVVVVSAYDALDGTRYERDPSLYLSERVALLDQYLKSNPEIFTSRVVGLSAQGTDYENQDAVAKLQTRINASDRIRVVATGSDVHHDVSEPIRWLATTSRTEG